MTVLLEGGESEPRRAAQEDPHIVAANHEATRVAHELGVSTLNPPPPPPSTSSTPLTAYTFGTLDTAQRRGADSGNMPKPPYSPLDRRSDLSKFTMAGGDESKLHQFDTHGQRGPYYEGLYYVEYREDGMKVTKRWYGRMEDGYLAWSSIYMHEWFGFTIYTPLTPDQQQQMQTDTAAIPKWLPEFASLPNVAIPLSYFCIGISLQLLRTPLIVYFITDLNASAAEVNVLFTVMAVPWCFKVICGFLSDCCPISGMRRKPYFMTGWFVYIISNLILAITPNPNIGMCILLVFIQTAGYMLADVMTDALIVERSRYETQEKRGTMQSTGYVIRFFGSTIGAAIGAVVYNKGDWDWYLPINVVFFINGAFPLFILLPFAPYLLELETGCAPKHFYKQCQDLFSTAQLRAVWQPMTFVYVYNALQLTNAAWMNFLVEGLDFSAWQIGIVGVFGSIMAWFGIMTYKRFFSHPIGVSSISGAQHLHL